MKFFKTKNNYDKFDKKKTQSAKVSKTRKFKSPKSIKKVYRATLGSLTTTTVGRIILDIFTNKTIFPKIAITVFLVGIFRALSAIPLPGIDMGAYKDIFGNVDASEANYLFAIFTGGQLDTPSVIGLGIAAYINASILVQLLTPIIPKLSELSKEGETGRQVINQYTRYLTLPLAFGYSVAYLLFLSKRDLNSADGVTASADPLYLIPHAPGSDLPSITKIVFMAAVLTAGSLLVMWLSEIITEKGIGNGSSIIIGIGILASLPALIKQDFSTIDFGNIFGDLIEGSFSVLTSTNVLILLGIIIGALVVVVSIIFVNESARKIPIQYARRARGMDGNSNLPLKLTLTGVLPMIFASALLSFPQIIIPLLENVVDKGSSVLNFTDKIKESFLYATTDGAVDNKDIWYIVLNLILIIGFSMFYSFIVMKPEDTAENLQKSGAFIPGIRPGNSTINYISIVLLRISFAGGLFLAFIGLLPLVSRNIVEYEAGVNMAILSGIGGTSILIVISVILDTVRQFNSLRVTKSYEKYAGK